ncbi:TetR/AcrR family transcriptional regulator [Halioxenophilus sp. WMMB6]|uniref:TetR/AcrR family transcriptional regulator n=1 Tax=Halioxenophilus sp. WMMB6 TaxID=3073815 RepID=UPI00295EDC24|nr:TetR/AcrR family transcriptional regulator [Halioxenophilus sp. WMMB6]
MISANDDDSKQRNKGYQKSHQKMVETAIKLIAEKGAEALSLADLARAMDVNRTTIYYHFKNRDELISEVKQWSSVQLAKGIDIQIPRQDRVDYITRYVLENPELIKLWLEDLISGKKIEECYPVWHKLVASTADLFAKEGEEIDAEIFCLELLISAFVTPLVFIRSVNPDESKESLIARISKLHLRNLSKERVLTSPLVFGSSQKTASED